MGVSTDFINTDYVQCKEMLENVSSSNPIATSYGKFYSFSQIYPFFNGARSAPQNTTVSDISVPVNGRRMRLSEDLARCTGCLETISEQFYCCVGEQIWHQACLRCCICGKLFSERCYTREGQLYCREDFMRHYGPKCTGCHKTIQATDLVQFAKSSIFHAKCFRCTICERQFTQGDQCCFARGNQLLICHEHYVATVQPHLNGIQSNSPPMTGVDQGQSRLNMDLTIPVETSVGGCPAISSSSSSPVGSFSSTDAHSTQGQSIANFPFSDTTLTTLNVRHSLYKPDLPQTISPNMPVTDSQDSCEAHHEMKSTNRMHELLPSKVWTTSIKNDTVHNDECMFVTKDSPWPQRTNFDGLTSSIKNQASWNLNSQTEYTQILEQEAQDNVRAVRKSSTDAGEMQHSLLNVVTEYNESHQKDDPAEDVLDNSPDPLVYLLQHQESQQSLAPDCSYGSQASPIYSTSGGLHLSEASSPQPSEVSENGTGPSVGDAPVTISTVTGAGGGGAKRRGPRTTIKAKQLETLKAAFAATPKPTRHVRESLAQETGLSMRVIQVWFQNRRSKERRMKQLNALGPRRGFYRNPRRLRGIRPGILHSELNNDTAVELMNNPVYQGYLLENNPELYNVLAATAAAASFNSNQCTVGPPLFNYPSSSEPILAGEMRTPTMNLPGAPTFDIPYPPFNPSFSPVTLTNNRINDAKNDIRYATPTYIPGVQTACRLPFTRLPSPASSTPPAPMFNDSFNLFPPQSLTTNHSQAPAGSLFTRSSLCSSAALP